METKVEVGFIEALFGTHSSAGEYIAFFIFVLISMSAIKIARYIKKRKELRSKGEIIKFSRKIWIEDNILDVILALSSAFLLFRFLPQAGVFLSNAVGVPEITGKMAYGVLLGLSLQYVWHKIMNKVEIKTK